MSTNSNQIDDLMQDNHNKQTKLQKFLRSLDSQIMKLIANYLQQHEPPESEANTKTDKIKLYQDLQMIQLFKLNQKKIQDGDKKIIDQLCQSLKSQMGYSAATIRQRIQKKLANVSIQQIRDHIRQDLNFTFNTKRKLVPAKNMKSENAEEDIFGFEQNRGNPKVQEIPSEVKYKPGSKQSKQMQLKRSEVNKNVVTLISSAQQHSADIMQQISFESSKKTKPQKQYTSSLNKNTTNTNAIEASQTKTQTNPSKQNMKIINNGLQRIEQKNMSKKKSQEDYNQFREGSDHESDEQIVIVNSGNQFKISTRKGQQNLQEILTKFKQMYIIQKNKQNQPIQAGSKNQVEQQRATENNKQNKKIEQNAAKEENNKNKKQEVIIDLSEQENNFHVQKVEIQKQEPRPSPEDLYQYCSLEDWKSAQNNSQYAYLKWHKDEDDFLSSIIAHSNPDKAISGLQVLKKFKPAANIATRMRFLGLSAPSHVISNLVGDH